MEFMELVDDSVIDLDFFLLDPDGNVIASSTISGGPENIDLLVTRAGTYKYRVTGFQNGPTNFTINSTQIKGRSVPPALQTVAGDFVDSQGRHVDFDGTFNIQWTPNGGEQGFEIEQSPDNQTWQIIADVASNVTSYGFTSLSNGQYFFRVRALYPGQIGLYVTRPSNVTSVLVDQRVKAEITTLVRTAMSNVSLSGGVFQLDLNMTNQSGNTYVPLVEFKIVSISSGSGTVQVINADNGGNGTSAANAALFDYSRQLGSDEKFTSAEVTGSRTMRFQDSASELFTFSAIVTAYQQVSGSSSSGAPPPDGGSSPSGSGSSTSLLGLTSLMRFTVNPALGTVSVTLVPIK
jgi:hypothetical protein